MLKFILKRLLWMIPVVLGVLFIVFALSRITPGDPVVALLGSDYTQEQYDAKREELGLNDPFVVQYGKYIYNFFTKFDLGTSYETKRAVADEILDRLPVTITLGILAVILTTGIGITFGVLSAIKQYSVVDYAVTTVSLFFAAMPNFWMALMMILLFSLRLHWLPATGLQTWAGYVMPVLAMGLSPIAGVTRTTRSCMLEVIRQDYIRTARAKGLAESVIVKRHALKNALIPVITVVGMQLSMIVGGSVVVETIFSIPGVGTLLMSAINARNYPVIQGTVLILSIVTCIMNLLTDIAYAYVDPRIKSQYVSKKEKIRVLAGDGARGEEAA